MSPERNRRDLADRAVDLATALQPRIANLLQAPREGTAMRRMAADVQTATGGDFTTEDFADQYAQSLVCGMTTMALAGDLFRGRRVRDWVLSHANPLWRNLLAECFSLLATPLDQRYQVDASGLLASCEVSLGDVVPSPQVESQDQAFYFFEIFLQQYDSRRRKKHGVFYTPRPIAQFIVAKTHGLLCDKFQLPDGLADTATWSDVAGKFPQLSIPDGVDPHGPFVRILDPALGTGVFLAEAIRLVHRRWMRTWLRPACDQVQAKRSWNEYVARHLLPRLCGLELMLPACVVANLNLARTLAETDFTFQLPARVEIHLTNSLAGPPPGQWCGPPVDLFAPVPFDTETGGRPNRTPLTVVVGNPPFSGISRDRSRWIIDLLRGRTADGRRWANYYEIDGQPLGERKTWLHDDYVKFMRLAHWAVETTGCGVVGLVTNHGYLDNPTFRGMRQQLLETFSSLAVLDLHGNRKKGEWAPDGGPDGNVFAIDQGTAIGLFCRPPGGRLPAERLYGDMWGSAEKKLKALRTAADDSTPLVAAAAKPPSPNFWQPVTPESPRYLYVPRDNRVDAEYARGVRLTDAMPRYVTAPVTARDGFVVAFTRDDLLLRMAEFRDLSIPDQEIRDRYFTRTRSPKYAAGDTRGWKLADARRRMADDPAWQDHILPCWYRPFDRRVIYWATWMIDWPRQEVMRDLLLPDSVGLVARRQMLPTQPRNFFWITDTLLLDGLIRSDNRGSEYVFPLFVSAPDEPQDAERRCANFSQSFIESVQRQIDLQWLATGAGDLQTTFGPLDVLHYTYALFFANTYRTRYADGLASDFPGVFLPRRTFVFAQLSRLGQDLAAAHLLRSDHPNSEQPALDVSWTLNGPSRLEAGFPKYCDGRVYVNHDVWLDGVTPQCWAFTVGSHRVCLKWLKDRRGRHLTGAERATYVQILRAIEETSRCVAAVDSAIGQQGGWTSAFFGESPA